VPRDAGLKTSAFSRPVGEELLGAAGSGHMSCHSLAYGSQEVWVEAALLKIWDLSWQ